MGILDVKELTAGTIKSGVNIKHSSAMVIKASDRLPGMLSGHLCYVGLGLNTEMR